MEKEIIKWFLYLTVLSNVVSRTGTTETVQIVEQNYKPKVHSQLVDLVGTYQKMELAYIAYASYFDRADVNLPGFTMYFRKNAKTVRDRAQGLTQYVNMRGGHVFFRELRLTQPETSDPVKKQPSTCEQITEWLAAYHVTTPRPAHICKFVVDAKMEKGTVETERQKWQSGLYGLEDTLALEKELQSVIFRVIQVAKDHTDPMTKHEMEEYLDFDFIKWTSDLVSRLRTYSSADYSLGEYLMEGELAKLQGRPEVKTP